MSDLAPAARAVSRLPRHACSSAFAAVLGSACDFPLGVDFSVVDRVITVIGVERSVALEAGLVLKVVVLASLR